MKLVVFYSDWCGPCKMYKETYDRFAEDFNVKIERVNIESDEMQQYEELGVRAVPTTAKFSDGGELLDIRTGMLSRSQLVEMVL